MHPKNKKPIKKLLVLKWTKFHVHLGNFYYYGLILVSYKENVYLSASKIRNVDLAKQELGVNLGKGLVRLIN